MTNAFKRRMLRGASATVALLGVGSAAFAADLPPLYAEPIYDEAPELQPVEIGTGWYLRGDVGYNFADSGYFIDRRETFRTPTNGNRNIELDANSEVSASLGVGYQFTDYFRGDVSAEWLATGDYDETTQDGCVVLNYDQDDNPFPASGSCRYEGDGDLDIYNFMANAYADLGTFVGVTPYVGAGIGIANVQASAKRTRKCNEAGVDSIGCLPSRVRGQPDTRIEFDDESSTWQLSYALAAGFGYDLSRNLKLDVGYRYVAIPETDLLGESYDENIDFHQIRAGLRYSLW